MALDIEALRFHARQFSKQAPAMRKAYVRGGLQYLAPDLALLRFLRSLAPASDSREIKAAVAAARLTTEIETVERQRSAINGGLNYHEMLLLYSLVTLRKPRLVIETGVAHGVSSSVMLGAMEANGLGKLVSIDMPTIERAGKIVGYSPGYELSAAETSIVPTFSDVGHLVPDHLKPRWELHLGDSLVLLPEIIPTLGPIDIFLHDSLHTKAHMTAEFRAVWPSVGPDGLVLADDIFVQCHDALAAFAASVGAKPLNYRGMGAITKP